MELDFTALSWVAIAVGIIAGQVVSTIWFVVLFGEPWAREYGAKSKKQHTQEVPPYTYGVGLVCTAALVVSIALLQHALRIQTVGAAIQLAIFLSVGLCVATGVPGQAFLRRWRVALIACGSQVAMILVISTVLVLLG
ncbi:MAG: DUF1761 domain-containing protein [Myxococcota bacterium]